MSVKRFAMSSACVLALALALGAGPAGAGGSPRVMAFVGHHVLLTWVTPSGKGTVGEAVSTIGSQAILSARLYNRSTEFGKAPGTAVGRVLLDCTILDLPADGNCTGIVHVPDGFFLIGGNGPFVPAPRDYAITGGIGSYATARGQVTIRTTTRGASLVDVVLVA
jgi:hypothetical protein